MGELRKRANEVLLKGDVIPEGFMTKAQWAKEEQCSDATIRRLLDALTETGEIEVREFKAKASTGKRILPIPHYRLIPVSRNAKPVQKKAAGAKGGRG